jgi:prevent-host-death family protein
MKSWSVQDAKARFSELLTACERDGPQIVTKRGADAAVLVPIEEWRRLNAARPTLKGLLLATEARCDDLVIPQRGAAGGNAKICKNPPTSRHA